jgi:hypothetical protein
MSIDVKAIIQNIIIALLTAAGLFCSILLLSYSWVKIFAIAAILVPGIIWLVTHGSVRKMFKYMIIGTLIFAISFTAFESYMLSNTGYPPTYSPQQPGVTLTDSSLLNASLTQIVDGIEKSPAYALLTVEHGTTIPRTIQLNTQLTGGSIEVDYYAKNSNAFFYFLSSGGYPYHVQVSSYIGRFPFQNYPNAVPPKVAFSQIDALSLQWFYNQALQLAQNRTGTAPKINALWLTINFEDRSYIGYEGITLQLIGSFNGQSTVICDFEPDGTLIYMSQPSVS